MHDLAAMHDAVVRGDRAAAEALARRAVERGGDLLAVVEGGFAAGIRRVGELWEEGEYFLPELVQGAEAMKAAMRILERELARRRDELPRRGRVVIGTVQGDLHDIGKALVATLLEANGFEVFDLGADVAPRRLVAKAAEEEAEIVAASALPTTTMPVQAALVEEIAAAGLRGSVQVLVGGAPASAEWAAEIGAEYAETAHSAVAVVRAALATAPPHFSLL